MFKHGLSDWCRLLFVLSAAEMITFGKVLVFDSTAGFIAAHSAGPGHRDLLLETSSALWDVQTPALKLQIWNSEAATSQLNAFRP